MKTRNKIIIAVVSISLIIFLGLLGYYNLEDKETSLTIAQKKWLDKNKNQTVNFSVVKDYPLYGYNGEGVMYTFANYLKKATNIDYNIIPYSKLEESSSKYTFKILDNDKVLNDNDILLGTDAYIAISKKLEKMNTIKEFSNKKLGILTQDVGEISYYLKTAANVDYKTYSDITTLTNGLNNDDVDMIVIPNIMYLGNTLSNKEYFTNYIFNEMSKKIVLELNDNNNQLTNIVKKIFNNWKDNYYVDELNKEMFSFYIKSNNINDKVSADLVSRSYVYGYVENAPYEVKKNGKIVGIAAEYINRVSRLTNIEFTFKKYNNIASLKKAINDKKVDIYFDYYDDFANGFKATNSTFKEEYAVLGKLSDLYTINSFESLKDHKITTLSNSSVTNYFKNNSKTSISEVNNINKLTKNDGLIVIDKEIYSYYRNSKFKNYELLYSDYITNDYKFMVNDKLNDFYNIFNYIINSNSYLRYRNVGLLNINKSIFSGNSFNRLYIIILAMVLLPLIIIFILYKLYENKKKVKDIKKDERQKYTDMLTSLKNRNYLNLNMPKWGETTVYPQAVIIADLNNVTYVNDNYGHEKGDELIVSAASILLNTQLENSEIIRTSGNEFLIYLVGYSDKQVSTYLNSLSKTFKELPYGFGASIGYSMITDSIKTLDDAINEATLDMRTNKEAIK